MTRTDTERLDALERMVKAGDCHGIINDEHGQWAVSADGYQDTAIGPDPLPVRTTFFVELKDWRPTVREAIDAYLDDEDDVH